jgi:hypothetical protein
MVDADPMTVDEVAECAGVELDPALAAMFPGDRGRGAVAALFPSL